MIPKNRVFAVSVAGAVALGLAGLTGCAAGRDPETTRVSQISDGTNASPRDRGVAIRNMFVLGPEPGQKLPAGGAAPLYVWLVNNSSAPDRLVGIGAGGLAQSAQIQGGGIDLPVQQLVTTVGKNSGPPLVVLQGLTRELRGGEWMSITLRFQRAGIVTVNTPVLARDGDYATFAPAPGAQPPGGTPTPTVSPAPNGSPTPAVKPADKKDDKAKKDNKPRTA